MNQTDIDKAFEGRWRIKKHVFSAEDHVQGEIKALCRDFFEAGILLAGEEELPVWRKPPTIVEADIPPEFLVRESDLLTVDDTFNYWWELYDKKRGRDKCITKWKKMTGTEHFACIAATPAYVESTPDKAYRKDPLTYLNGKCWNDEIIVKNNGNKTNDDLRKLASILTD